MIAQTPRGAARRAHPRSCRTRRRSCAPRLAYSSSRAPTPQQSARRCHNAGRFIGCCRRNVSQSTPGSPLAFGHWSTGDEESSLRTRRLPLQRSCRRSLEVRSGELEATSLRGFIPIPSVEYATLEEHDWFKYALLGDVGFEVGEVILVDHGEQVGELAIKIAMAQTVSENTVSSSPRTRRPGFLRFQRGFAWLMDTGARSRS
jgi:hypothetical protein